MKRTMRMMGPEGDKVIAEWDTEEVTQEKLDEIEAEFERRMQQGYFAADITDKRDVLVRKFDPAADILLIPQMRGGVYGIIRGF